MSAEHGVPSAAGFVAIVGPPAVGTSTVTGALADRFGTRLFRLREFAHEFRTRPGVNQRLFDAGDCLNLLDIADEIGVSLVKFHVFSVIGAGHGAAEWGMPPLEWIKFYEQLEHVAPGHRTRVWYQPTYARRDRIAGYAVDGYRGCIGRTLDRISIFPDGRAYVCSFLFDTDLHFANMVDGQVVLNHGDNEFDLFTRALSNASCGGCKAPGSCLGGCPPKRLSWARPPARANPTSCQSAGSGRPTSPLRSHLSTADLMTVADRAQRMPSVIT